MHVSAPIGGEGKLVCKALSRMTALQSLSMNGMALSGAPVLVSNIGRALHGMTQLVELHKEEDLFYEEICEAVSTMTALKSLRINGPRADR